MHLVGYLYEDYHVARSLEYKTVMKVTRFSTNGHWMRPSNGPHPEDLAQCFTVLLTTCVWSFCLSHFPHSFLGYCTLSTLSYCNASIFLMTCDSLQLIHYLLFLNQRGYDVNYRFPTPGQRMGTPTVLESIEVTITFL